MTYPCVDAGLVEVNLRQDVDRDMPINDSEAVIFLARITTAISLPFLGGMSRRTLSTTNEKKR